LAFKRERIGILGIGASRFGVFRLRCGHSLRLAHRKPAGEDLRG